MISLSLYSSNLLIVENSIRLFIQCIEYSFSSLLVLYHCKYAIHGEEVSLMLSGASLANVGDIVSHVH